jgi:hypothetical protein
MTKEDLKVMVLRCENKSSKVPEIPLWRDRAGEKLGLGGIPWDVQKRGPRWREE